MDNLIFFKVPDAVPPIPKKFTRIYKEGSSNIYVSATMHNLKNKHDIIKNLSKTFNIKYLLCFDSEASPIEEPICIFNNIKLINKYNNVTLIVQDFTNPTLDQIIQTVNLIEECIDKGVNLLMHCWGGTGRTGCFLAAFLIKKYGLGVSQAINEVRNKYDSHCVEIVQQYDALKDYRNTLNLDRRQSTAIFYPAHGCDADLDFYIEDLIEKGFCFYNYDAERIRGQNPEVRIEQNPEARRGQNPEVRRGQNPEVRIGQNPEVRIGQNPEVRRGQNPEVRRGQNPEVRRGQNPEVTRSLVKCVRIACENYLDTDHRIKSTRMFTRHGSDGKRRVNLLLKRLNDREDNVDLLILDFFANRNNRDSQGSISGRIGDNPFSFISFFKCYYARSICMFTILKVKRYRRFS